MSPIDNIVDRFDRSEVPLYATAFIPMRSLSQIRAKMLTLWYFLYHIHRVPADWYRSSCSGNRCPSTISHIYLRPIDTKISGLRNLGWHSLYIPQRIQRHPYRDKSRSSEHRTFAEAVKLLTNTWRLLLDNWSFAHIRTHIGESWGRASRPLG